MAVTLYRQAAEKGHAHAAFNLGMCARHGRGMERNDTIAAGAIFACLPGVVCVVRTDGT